MIDKEGHKKLKIWQLSHKLGIKVHKMSLALPKFEMFEEGSQVRRSSKSVSSNITEGYALRRYKAEYIHYLFRAYASSMETVEHLEYLYETNSLKDKSAFDEMINEYSELNKMLFSFIESVEKMHSTDILKK
ncbi:MAG: ribosomal protein [Candidatus Scalindua rubra]|uniref:Ribosomal protein n=1 Tax=Candidatus Scalindua rubra TaxID=1872076 RepID=A0A1E3XFY2_9BACT|nr:MAG: ribosomal protein [Candidatus Scalindua rubra]